MTATLVGVALVILLPESLFGDGVLFRLSDRHGPGIADTVGIAIMLIGWVVYLHAVWSRWPALRPRWAAIALPIAAVVLSVGCIAAFAADQDDWAYSLASAALAAQAALCFTAPRRGSGASHG
jgi:hypothetical protein